MAVTTRQTEMESVNPATEEVLGRFPLHSKEQVNERLDRARQAFKSWRETSFDERARLFHEAARRLRDNKSHYATIITMEMGKPVVEAEAEIEKCAWGCDYYAENAKAFLADQPHPSNASESYVAFDPLGTVLAVMPWNFPFWQVFRFAAPTLMAGNTAVLKHASNVPQCALAIEEVFRSSGFPEGVFQTLLISGSTAEEIIADPRIAAVTLTGSSAAGKKIASAAGAALKKSVLELGGSDPFIVLEDADLEAAVPAATRGRNQNTGQSCIAAKRFIVAEAIADEFIDRFEASVSALKVGDPMDRPTQVGPMARADLRDALDRQVKASIVAGAEVVLGAKRPSPGFYYTPVILADVTSDMPVYREETFGPVAAIVRFHDVEEALFLANDTQYGLGAALWTSDMARAKQLARRIEAGSVFINGMVASDLRLPFGGVKQSGYGRELSEFGIREFTNVKTVWIGPANSSQTVQRATE